MNEPTASVELPLYTCHKQVRAAKIAAITRNDDGSAIVFPYEPAGASINVSADYVQKHAPVCGGYYVVYADGYASFSPAHAFESGYTLTGGPKIPAPIPGVRRYRKKPVVIEAFQFDGSPDAILTARLFVGPKFEETVTETGIQTLEGFMRVTPGDFIIKGVNGEFYPCKPDIFAKTYEDAGTEASPLNAPSPDNSLQALASNIVEIVEGPGAPRWAAGGLRLKDTREWCAFYCAVKAAEREATATDAKPDLGNLSDGYHTFNELYEHRHALFLALAHFGRSHAGFHSWMSLKHHDGSQLHGWFIAGIDLPTGKTITYHLPIRLYHAAVVATLANVLPVAPPWDGHTSADVIKRFHEAIP